MSNAKIPSREILKEALQVELDNFLDQLDLRQPEKLGYVVTMPKYVELVMAIKNLEFHEQMELWHAS